ncbi:hypothetical protein [Curvibacter lanceolatus]|uniref:hypothetical protein n=1 Tax=Curvibacter lanceolatus TaxID=86182 RepID=UPI0003A58EDD|nr:hypothetical protein [Curvibacter lanceolatus]
MTKPLTIMLNPNEQIVAVTPEICSGPGWVNAPTWVHIVDYSTAKHRAECIQPDERTPALDVLFSAAEAMQGSLLAAVPTKTVKGKT